MSSLLFLFGGLGAIVLGILILKEGGFLYYGVYVYGRFPGFIAIITGLMSFRVAYNLWQTEKKELKYGKHLKCSKCGAVYRLRDLADPNCLRCGIQLENLEGFYKRHQNFKE